jgi:lipopolysaccharide/colanic/teichoic acid biosynthesis glycosyltransferase/GT2 family glycosyltransferase
MGEQDRTQPARVSVIVPVYNDVDRLERCLTALRAQRYAEDEYEIIVVDDGSIDNPKQAAQAYGARTIIQGQQGPAAARNAGARTAHGEILVFTDSDCAPSRDWLSKMLEPFDDPRVVGVKGIYGTHQKAFVPRFVQQEYEAKYRRMASLKNIDFIDTYSAAYRRDVFLENGGFDTAFPVPSVEDQEFSFRLARKGYPMVFAPAATVYHIHDWNLREYLQRKFNIGYWKAIMLRRVPEKLLSDSHTLPAQRLQIAFLLLALAAALASALWPAMGLVALCAIVLFFGVDVPFLYHVARREPRLLIAVPGLLVARAAALGAGLLIGLLFPPSLQPKGAVGLQPLERGLKRILDIFGAIVGLILSIPFVAAAAVAIRLDSPGPIFFRQARAGEHGKPFEVLKLRTMVQGAELRVEEVLDQNPLDGPVFKIPNDPRVTRVGRWLRRWSLDELPQFWNVLKGEMSLVGPRPEETWVVAQYNDEQRQRLSVKPGLTGPMQVGGRGSLDMEQRLALDLEYIQNYSLGRDLKILLQTITAVFKAEGAY